VGVNLSEAMADGQLTPQDYSEMVTSCRNCVSVDQCQHWLATQAVTRCAAFEACLHKPMLDRLQGSVARGERSLT